MKRQKDRSLPMKQNIAKGIVGLIRKIGNKI